MGFNSGFKGLIHYHTFILCMLYCYTFLRCCFCGRIHQSLLQNENYFYMHHTNLLDRGEWKN